MQTRTFNGQSFLETLLLLALIVMASIRASAQIYSVVGFDPQGDGRDTALADAAQLSYRYDKQQDLLWLRLSLYGIPHEQSFGVHLAFDTGGDETAKLNWWGGNKAFKFDRLVTARVARGESGYQGTIGLSDAAGAQSKQFNNLLQHDLQIRVDGDAILIGVKRTDITDQFKFKLIAAVGSQQQWNDDLPNVGAITIDLAAERPPRGLAEIDVSRNNLAFAADYKTLANQRPPVIIKKGQGKQPLILIPGMYSSARSFAEFIARNQARYKFYVVTPPGLQGTPARPMPAAGTSFSNLTWTRQLEQDILALIRGEKLVKPVIVAERQPGSVAAMELALEQPDQIGGVILVGTNLTQFFLSPKDPGRKSPVTLPERVKLVDEGWAVKWFKYVTLETWNSGDLLPEWFSSDAARAQQAWEELEAAPLPVKIRYLCEYWASDVTLRLDRLRAPVLAVIPNFDEKFLANPTNSFTKTSFVDPWEPLASKQPKLELVKIPDARLLVLEDQPNQADDAIAMFVAKMEGSKSMKSTQIVNRSAPGATVAPLLIYEDVAKAIDWLCDTFGFTERLRAAGPDGKLNHAQLAIAEGSVILGRQGGEFRVPRPKEVSQYVFVHVEDVDKHFEQARGRGAQILQPPMDMPFGERQYTAEDPWGHRWTFSQSIADVAPGAWGARQAK